MRTPHPLHRSGSINRSATTRGPLAVDDPGRQAVAGVRPDGADLAAAAVETHGEEALLVHPERIVEPLLELGRLVKEPFRLGAAVEPPQHFGELQLGGVDEPCSSQVAIGARTSRPSTSTMASPESFQP